MASAFVKNTGILHLLLFGLLLPSVLVSVEALDSGNTSTAAPTTTASSIITFTSIQQTSTNMSYSSTASSPGTRQSTISSGNGGTVTTIATTTSTQPPTSTSGGSTQSTTQSLKSTSGNMTSNSTLLPTSSTSGGFSTTQFHTSTSKGSSNMMNSSSMNSTANGTSTMFNSTSMNMTHLHCRSFSCAFSECYWMYINQNATMCTAGYCQLLKTKDMWYSVGCSASCAERCTNATQTNCSVNCCNATGCLRGNFVSMNITLTTTATTTSTTAKTTQSASTVTLAPADNQNQCSTGTCTGDGCYSAFKTTLQACTSSQPHCQLKKQLVNAVTSWTAGCTNCTGVTTCQSTTQPPCVQECCKASTTSCLKLDGSLNVPSFATRGPHLHMELIVSTLCLLAMALLL